MVESSFPFFIESFLVYSLRKGLGLGLCPWRARLIVEWWVLWRILVFTVIRVIILFLWWCQLRVYFIQFLLRIRKPPLTISLIPFFLFFHFFLKLLPSSNNQIRHLINLPSNLCLNISLPFNMCPPFIYLLNCWAHRSFNLILNHVL